MMMMMRMMLKCLQHIRWSALQRMPPERLFGLLTNTQRQTDRQTDTLKTIAAFAIVVAKHSIVNVKTMQHSCGHVCSI